MTGVERVRRALRRHPAVVLTASMVAIGLLAARDMGTGEFTAALRALLVAGLLAAAGLALRYQWAGKGYQAVNLLRLALGLWVIAGVAGLLS
ncbi:hypothetical protein SME13J_50320 (plasmid) [Serratia marcescens]|jgi:hypothetical protein|uniref:hypothetical protein n=1 Tax=Serratia marcescens TaxID=615 RepID=UPI001F4C2AE9|nr:hypothetical protein [Serratia marcescens]ULG13132.1 hypothetical protein 1573p1_00072 [Serratia marcescens]BEM46413.1 hypothetical protein SME13J_50320 [Serratia marcescens]